MVKSKSSWEQEKTWNWHKCSRHHKKVSMYNLSDSEKGTEHVVVFMFWQVTALHRIIYFVKSFLVKNNLHVMIAHSNIESSSVKSHFVCWNTSIQLCVDLLNFRIMFDIPVIYDCKKKKQHYSNFFISFMYRQRQNQYNCT